MEEEFQYISKLFEETQHLKKEKNTVKAKSLKRTDQIVSDVRAEMVQRFKIKFYSVKHCFKTIAP
jgi:hypothetical protein